jgi:para-nitrobenzyl esterase
MKGKINLTLGTLVLALPIVFYSFSACTSALPSAIKTDAGIVSGAPNAIGDVVAFKGVPFAAPPVGNLRWKAPQPAQPWSGVKQCTAFGPSPMQNKPAPFMVWTSEFLIPEAPISEDCLYLNVWTNAKSDHDKKPVYVWIYGGGFMSGGTACPIYDGEAMAKKGVIVVSVNYRVGVFGFFAHPELSKESRDKVSGNYGLLDQIAGLKWVQKNIAAFGGDPDNVTIGGQSAGSMSVNDLVATPLAKGLFKRAIGESGSQVIKQGGITTGAMEAAERRGTATAEKAGVKSLTELRAMTAEDAMKKLAGGYGPIVDGYVLPEPVANIFAENKQNHVAIITGWNLDDVVFTQTKNKEDYKKQVASDYGADSTAFFKSYPATTNEEAKQSQRNLGRDQVFGASGYKWAQLQSKYDDSPAWVYNFNRKVPGTGAHANDGAFHTGEVPYVFDNLKFLDRPHQPSDYELAKLMSAYWVNFIKTGDPNGDGLPQWPKFNSQENKAMIFDEQLKVVPLPGKDGLDILLAKAEK